MHAAAGHLKCTYCICDALCMHVAELQRHLTQYHAHVATEHDLKTPVNATHQGSEGDRW